MLESFISIILPLLVVIAVVYITASSYDRLREKKYYGLSWIRSATHSIDDELASIRRQKALAKINYYVQAGKEELIEETKRAAMYYRGD